MVPDEEPTQEPEPQKASEYTIDDLAALTRVPSRTIRFYQSKGVLPRPQLRGRVAYYTDVHIERLRLVAELQDRGLQIKAIGHIVARLDKGELALNEWLGLEAQLKEPWANDRPKLVEAEELKQMVGEDRPGKLTELIRAGLVERKGDAFIIPSPTLFSVVIKLEVAGFALSSSVEAGFLMRRHLSRAAKNLVDFFVEHAGNDTRASDAAPVSELMQTLRPTAMEALHVIFAQEIEREIRSKLVESGQSAKLTRKSKRLREPATVERRAPSLDTKTSQRRGLARRWLVSHSG